MGDRDADLASLRAELLGPEQRKLSAIESRLDDRLARAHDLAEVLPTVLQQHAHDPDLAKALTPPVEKAITASVQRNPQPLADALFPVMGPAIRKAVAAGLAGMVESLNRTLELSVSVRSLRWRVEAWRTGRSFGEIVLSKTLLYRVEQVFLIERRSGLLLQHVRAGAVPVQDADMVSGMLTAIRDFVQDSFRVTEGDSLDSLVVGDLAIWIESGPHAVVAAVIRGAAPREYRRRLVDAVETIHLQFGAAFQSFEGDATAFAESQPTLEACLETEYRATERKSRRGPALAVAVLVIAALVYTAASWIMTSRREARYVDALRAEPGLVVLSAEHRGGRLHVRGLRDPLARDPSALLPADGPAPDRVDATWTAYHALDPAIVLTRAREMLRPPPGVDLALDAGVLSTRGEAPLVWIAETRRLAPLVAGVASFDAAAAVAERAARATTGIAAARLLFAKGTADLVPGQEEVVATIAQHLGSLDALAGAAGLAFAVEITGHADADGPPEANLPLSGARAAVVRAALSPERWPHLQVTTSGRGSNEPEAMSQNEVDNQRNRRVTIRVVRAAAPVQGSQGR